MKNSQDTTELQLEELRKNLGEIRTVRKWLQIYESDYKKSSPMEIQRMLCLFRKWLSIREQRIISLGQRIKLGQP